MKRGFSLIELLITLIIISLLIGAFSPIITKKLKASDVAVGNFNGNSSNALITREVTEEDCKKFKAVFIPKEKSDGIRNICVSKYNVGDNIGKGGVPFASRVKKVPIGQTCTQAGNCCWQGKTAAACTDDTNYSGCNRTVCQWSAANASCQSYAPIGTKAGNWRLPNENELIGWAKSGNINETGLQLCAADSDSVAILGISCHYAENQCLKNPYDFQNFNCHPYMLFSNSFSAQYTKYNHSNNIAHFILSFESGDFLSQSYNRPDSMAASARCVLDEITDHGPIREPDDNEDNKPFAGEPKDQADCDKLTAIFIDKLMSGAKRNICVSKYNVGDIGPDGSGPNIPEEFKRYVIGAGQSCPSQGYCCWMGKTARSCSTDGNNGANYSGCNRTICQWNVANEACKQYSAFGATKAGAWRLPKTYELEVWLQNLDKLDNNKGSDGLQLCTKNNRNGFILCSPIGNYSSSIPDGYSRPYNLLSNLATVNLYLGDSHIVEATYSENFSASARCVYDGLDHSQE